MAAKKAEPVDESSEDLFSLLNQATGQDVFGLEMARNGSQAEEISPVVAQRRQEILDAALKIFAKKGFDGSRTKEIAGAAGVSEATIFKYFPTKRHLLLGIMRPVVESIAKPFFLAPISKIVDGAAERGLEATLVLIAIDRYELVLKNRRLIRTLILELGRQEDMLSVFRQLLMPIILTEVGRIFDGARQRGEIAADINRQVFTRNLLSTIMGNIALLQLAPEAFSITDYKTEMAESIRIFVRGIQGGKV